MAPAALPASSRTVKASPIGPWLRDRCKHAALDPGVVGQTVEPGGESLDRILLGDQDAGGGDELLDVALVDLGEQVFSCREVPVERPLPNARRLRDGVEAQLARHSDLRPGGLQDPDTVELGIRSTWSVHHGASRAHTPSGHVSARVDLQADTCPP